MPCNFIDFYSFLMLCSSFTAALDSTTLVLHLLCFPNVRTPNPEFLKNSLFFLNRIPSRKSHFETMPKKGNMKKEISMESEDGHWGHIMGLGLDLLDLSEK